MLARPQAPEGAGPRQTRARPGSTASSALSRWRCDTAARSHPRLDAARARASQRLEGGRASAAWLAANPRAPRPHPAAAAAAARLVKWRPHRRFELKRDNPGGCGMQKTFPEWALASAFPRDFGSHGIGPSHDLFEVSSGVKASTASHPRPSSSRQVRGLVSARARTSHIGGQHKQCGWTPPVTPALTRLPTIAASRITPDRAAYQHASAATAAVACASHSLYLAGFRRAAHPPHRASSASATRARRPQAPPAHALPPSLSLSSSNHALFAPTPRSRSRYHLCCRSFA
jgi:hypothetical protein